MPLITFDDFLLLREKVRQGHGRRILRALATVVPSDKVRKAWSRIESPPVHWGSLEQVRRRWNQLATGDPDTPVYKYLADGVLADRSDLVALSVGCGTGAHELRFARTGKFRRIDAFDVSHERIREALREARNAGYDDRLNFFTADARSASFGESKYDVVLAFNALHHVAGLQDVIRRLIEGLKPDGIFVLWDYVGPHRFQWSKRQIEEVDKLLHEVPERLRHQWRSGTVKERVYRRGTLGMRLIDPSEAVESDTIVEALGQSTLRLIESRPLGGAILQPLLADIAHNFDAGDPEAMEWLERVFRVEDELTDTGVLRSDFVFAAYRK